MDNNMLWIYILIPVIVAVSGFSVAIIKKKMDEIEEKIQNEKVKKYLNMSENLLVDVIRGVNQTYVDSLKDEGKFNKEAQEKALEMAKKKFLAIISQEAREAIQEGYKDLGEWLNIKIHATVREEKKPKIKS